ncbi:MAG TPA: NAD(+) synthase, partial [Leptospiraceae bacterium]|nr:NAD(+) synthase [Leptospiraceae bacterium]
QKAHAILDTSVVVGLPVRYHERIYNCAAILREGKIQCIIPKQNLAGDGIHYEPRWFTAWRGRPVEYELPDHSQVPMGPMVLDQSGIRIAFEICEDCWVPNRPADKYTEASPDLILCPSASHFAFGKENIRRGIAVDSSRSYACVYAMVNLLGNESGRSIYDGCAIVASLGNLLYEGTRFSFKDYTLHTVDVDIAAVRSARSRLYSFKEQNELTEYAMLPLNIKRAKILSATPPGPPDSMSKELEFLHAVSLGLFDYLRKSHSKGYVVSLSGGADSAACALLVERMLRLAERELGSLANQKLGLTPNAGVHDILHTIYQAAEQSSQTTRTAAREVARALRADHHEESISDTVESYTTKIETILGRKLTWQTDDLSLQNIQARVRSPLAWLFANTTGSILITTSNRSEGSVGYCTMDGDTSGG